MKVRPECAACLLGRGLEQLEQIGVDSETRFKTAQALLEMLDKKFGPEAVPGYLGTDRDRIIKVWSGNPDPYLNLKHRSNSQALDIEPAIQKIIDKYEDSYLRFRTAMIIAIVGNIVEFGILGYQFTFDEISNKIENGEQDLVIDDIENIFNIVKKAKHLLYLTDNAGEIVFDKFLVNEIQQLGVQVTVAVKGSPVLNDATMGDAEETGMIHVADQVITTGADSVGLILDEVSDEFMNVYKNSPLIIAKGMGHWETIPEQNPSIPIIYLLRTKCQPVADSLNVPRHKNVAKLVLPTE